MQSGFVTVPSDEDISYDTIEELIADFQPGNFRPTQEQAWQLVECAVRTAIRWVELRTLKGKS